MLADLDGPEEVMVQNQIESSWSFRDFRNIFKLIKYSLQEIVETKMKTMDDYNSAGHNGIMPKFLCLKKLYYRQYGQGQLQKIWKKEELTSDD